MIEAIAEQDKNRGKLSQEDYEFWRNLGLEYYEKQERKLGEDNIQRKEWEMIQRMSLDFEIERSKNHNLRNKVAALEASSRLAIAHLEKISQYLNIDTKSFANLEKQLAKAQREEGSLKSPTYNLPKSNLSSYSCGSSKSPREIIKPASKAKAFDKKRKITKVKLPQRKVTKIIPKENSENQKLTPKTTHKD